MSKGLSCSTDLGFDITIEKVRNNLKREGFGVLTEIDVKKALKEKLDVDYDNYLILGACNPRFAHKALQVNKEAGLLLPCNVIVYSEGGRTIVSAIDPPKVVSLIDNVELRNLAEEVREKLRRVIKDINKKERSRDERRVQTNDTEVE